jgi:hypothetical protein
LRRRLYYCYIINRIILLSGIIYLVAYLVLSQDVDEDVDDIEQARGLEKGHGGAQVLHRGQALARGGGGDVLHHLMRGGRGESTKGVA